jgi:hypothetical protein
MTTFRLISLIVLLSSIAACGKDKAAEAEHQEGDGHEHKEGEDHDHDEDKK